MPRGYPDFFSIPMFPTFGPVDIPSPSNFIVNAGEQKILLDIAYKAVIAGGCFELEWTGDGNDVSIFVQIDGQLVSETKVDEFFGSLGEFISGILKPLYYNEADDIARIGFVQGFDFGYQFRITIENATAVQLLMDCNIIVHKVL